MIHAIPKSIYISRQNGKFCKYSNLSVTDMGAIAAEIVGMTHRWTRSPLTSRCCAQQFRRRLAGVGKELEGLGENRD